jgi:hypothetical protein
MSAAPFLANVKAVAQISDASEKSIRAALDALIAESTEEIEFDWNLGLRARSPAC